MPAEAQEAVLIANLCRRWGYKPEEALAAPVWVRRFDAIIEELEAEAS